MTVDSDTLTYIAVCVMDYVFVFLFEVMVDILLFHVNQDLIPRSFLQAVNMDFTRHICTVYTIILTCVSRPCGGLSTTFKYTLSST